MTTKPLNVYDRFVYKCEKCNAEYKGSEGHECKMLTLEETETLDQTACKAIDPATITWTDRVMEKAKNPYETLEDWLDANHQDWRLLLPEQLVDLIIKEY